MKKLLLALALAGLTATQVNAQGKIDFSDLASADVATGLGFPGSDFSITLFGSTSSALAANFVPLFTTTYFGAANGAGDPGVDGAGLFAAGEITLDTGFAAGSTLNYQVRVWRNSGLGSGTSFATSQWQGVGGVYQAVLGGGTVPTASTTPEVITISAAPVPEPTTFALAGLGAAAMFIFRRRK
ncbi:MAG: PEP-CTERM sorting domain-containing protein [Verrucomicrobiota bacterium]